eukprot:355066-Chlamydomonas_euryale.AAC.18
MRACSCCHVWQLLREDYVMDAAAPMHTCHADFCRVHIHNVCVCLQAALNKWTCTKCGHFLRVLASRMEHKARVLCSNAARGNIHGVLQAFKDGADINSTDGVSGACASVMACCCARYLHTVPYMNRTSINGGYD